MRRHRAMTGVPVTRSNVCVTEAIACELCHYFERSPTAPPSHLRATCACMSTRRAITSVRTTFRRPIGALDTKATLVAKLPEGYTPFVYREADKPTTAPDTSLPDDEKLAALISEVERNGYGDDLLMNDGDSMLTANCSRLKLTAQHFEGPRVVGRR